MKTTKVDNNSSQVDKFIMSEMVKALKIAMDGWKRCFIAYGKDAAGETIKEASESLDNDPDWQKANAILIIYGIIKRYSK